MPVYGDEAMVLGILTVVGAMVPWDGLDYADEQTSRAGMEGVR